MEVTPPTRVSVATIRLVVGSSGDGTTFGARLLTCADVGSPAWRRQHVASRGALLHAVSEWLDEMGWGDPPGPHDTAHDSS